MVYFGGKTTIKYFRLNVMKGVKNIKTDIKLQDNQVQSIDLDRAVHGFLMNMSVLQSSSVIVAIETEEDYQIDFNKFHVNEIDRTYTFQQAREVVPRKKVIVDPYVKMKHVFNQGVNYSVGIRQSGEIDLYYNLMRVDSPEGVYVTDIQITYDSIYLEMKDGTFMEIHHGPKAEIEFDGAVPVTFNNFKFENSFYQNIKKYVDIFTNYIFLKNYIFVSHDRFISVYDMSDQCWWHWKFHADIQELFRRRNKKKPNQIDFGIILRTGEVYLDMYTALIDTNKLFSEALQNCRKEILNGELLCFENDTGFFIWQYFLVKELDELKLYCMNSKEMFLLPDLEEFLTEKTKIVNVQSPNETCQLVFQNETEIILFDQIYIEKDNGVDGETFATVELQQTNTFQIPGLYEQIKEKHETIEIEHTIHSVVSQDSSKYLFLADYKNIHQIILKNGRVRTFNHQNSCALYLLDDLYAYSLNHSSMALGTFSGLRMYNLDNILQTKKCNSFLLASVQIGCSSVFDYSLANSRLCYINSFDFIQIIPTLHRNTFSIAGISKKYKILDTKTVGNRLYILNNNNQISVYNLITGKIITQNQLKHLGLQTYQPFSDNSSSENDLSVYRLGIFTNTLIMNQEPETVVEQNDVYQHVYAKSTLKNQKTFAEGLSKRYHKFKLIDIIDERSVKEICNFIFPYYTYSGCKQILYFNEDISLMLEIQNDNRVFLYQSTIVRGTKIRWDLVRKLYKFPDYLMIGSKYYNILCPEFTRYIDIDMKSLRFMIMNLADQTLVTYIPNDYMHITDDEDPQLYINRFLFLGPNTFRIVNKEGFEKIVEFTDEIVNEQRKEAKFTELSYNKIPLFLERKRVQTYDGIQIIESSEYLQNNFFTNRPYLPARDTLQRLKKNYQIYKCCYYLEGKTHKNMMYQHLFNIDFEAYVYDQQILMDLSFTYLHWKIIEQLEVGDISVDNLDDDTIHHLIYNILPGGNTVLHRLNQKEEELQKIFNRCHIEEDDKLEIKYHLPVFQNLNGDSPLHLCNQNMDYKSMDTMIKYLSAYHIDHHSRAINDLLPVFIEKNLPSFPTYLASRLIQTDQLRGITKGCLDETKLGIITSHLWFEEVEFQGKLMKEKPIENRIKCEFIDMPHIFNYNHEVSKEFYGALADSDNIDLFQQKVIQKMILYNFPLIVEYTTKKLFYPYLTLQLMFFIYMSFIYDYRTSTDFMIFLDYTFMIGMAILSTYFLKNELIQFWDNGLEYLTSIWNYIDTLPMIFLDFIIVQNLMSSYYEFDQWVLCSTHAITAFFLWFKFLYFLRIFRETSYLIRMIICVISDMKYFLFMLVITIFAFGDSFNNIAKGNTGDDLFTTGFVDATFYTYRMILGDFDTSDMGSIAVTLCYIFFVICTLLDMIVMLNLLIAIISDSFASVTANAENASYQEMASMISENQYMIPEEKRKPFDVKDHYLLVVSDLEKDEAFVRDPFINKIQMVERKIQQRFDEQVKIIANLEEQIQKINGTLDKQFPKISNKGSVYSS